MMRTTLLLSASLALVACGDPKQSNTEGVARPAVSPPAAQAAVSPVVPTGPAQTVAAVASTEYQEAASVSQLHSIPEQDAKVFSMSGGDPAVNGLVTYLGLYIDAAEGWRIYPIGDFAEWRVSDITDQRVILNVRQDEATAEGSIQGRDLRVIVEFSWIDEMPAPSIKVTQGR